MLCSFPFLVGPSSCGLESGTGGVGAPCTRDRDCEGDLVCRRGVCALPEVDGGLDASPGDADVGDADADAEASDADVGDADVDAEMEASDADVDAERGDAEPGDPDPDDAGG
ncbi:MAG: hypothetical protein KF901_13205 [Myxococcales bacterium]|nr:hypothetical protein [Myxococcales bacterium]